VKELSLRFSLFTRTAEKISYFFKLFSSKNLQFLPTLNRVQIKFSQMGFSYAQLQIDGTDVLSQLQENLICGRRWKNDFIECKNPLERSLEEIKLTIMVTGPPVFLMLHS
jgi:hypothetical protein